MIQAEATASDGSGWRERRILSKRKAQLLGAIFLIDCTTSRIKTQDTPELRQNNLVPTLHITLKLI